ncbi:cytochrome c oxidase subunit II [uncultured Xylophilus sp.]|uniref:cytochrome c oxidase subunit II n=1 Tax=uncultured Xylophilus sp. TaxID=296832 RepID=UPI0025E0CFA4|nr:cytochrome c oxidase subunit II [uncultured Xylophilus sp.]
MLAACDTRGPLSTLAPAGPGAAEIAWVWWAMCIGAAVVTAGMTALALWAVYRPTGGTLRSPRALLVGGGVLLPLAAIAAVLAIGGRSGDALRVRGEPGVLRIEVTAHQWWWEAAYPDAAGGPRHTAGVLHIPAGRPVDIGVRSADVIHSFWVPRLGGKIDAVPGRRNTVRLQADAPGTYRGQCAEFCGLGHARMAFVVEAHAPNVFDARLAALPTVRPAAAPEAAP